MRKFNNSNDRLVDPVGWKEAKAFPVFKYYRETELSKASGRFL